MSEGIDGLSVNGPCGDGTPEAKRNGSVHGITDENAAPPFIRRGDVSHGGRPGGGEAPVHWGSQVNTASLGGRCV